MSMYGRSSSGRLRRPPQRWEGAAITGGVLARLPPAPAEASTASLPSMDSDSSPPGVFDAREELQVIREQALDLKAVGRGPDALALIRDTQRTLISRIAASHKSRHSYIKRNMRKRSIKLGERTRIEEAALRNAVSATGIITPGASATGDTKGNNNNDGPNVVPNQIRLPLEAYIPRRVHKANTIHMPADIIDSLPDAKHLLLSADEADVENSSPEGGDEDGNRGGLAYSSRSHPRHRCNDNDQDGDVPMEDSVHPQQRARRKSKKRSRDATREDRDKDSTRDGSSSSRAAAKRERQEKKRQRRNERQRARRQMKVGGGGDGALPHRELEEEDSGALASRDEEVRERSTSSTESRGRRASKVTSERRRHRKDKKRRRRSTSSLSEGDDDVSNREPSAPQLSRSQSKRRRSTRPSPLSVSPSPVPRRHSPSRSRSGSPVHRHAPLANKGLPMPGVPGVGVYGRSVTASSLGEDDDDDNMGRRSASPPVEDMQGVVEGNGNNDNDNDSGMAGRYDSTPVPASSRSPETELEIEIEDEIDNVGGSSDEGAPPY